MTQIAERAREMLDVPFLHQGRNKIAIDCVGLAAHVFNFPAEEIPPYPADPINGELETTLTALFGPAVLIKPTIDQLREGDLVAMQYKGPLRHVGIVLNHPVFNGALSLIHTDYMVGKVTELSLDFKWLRRIEKVWRLEPR